ncbi:MAG: hypothetical protein Ct9H90mP13_11180 [Pseudomonadota bacterium]|nr:MAG: hypothetical protein Ct9H90mP13_11180 [Pseudomonadota bacterium]
MIHGRGVAEIIESKHSDYKEGEIVQGQMGWQTYKASKMTDKEKFRKIPDMGAPYSLGLSLLGMTGLSAYFGYFSHGNPNRGETVVFQVLQVVSAQPLFNLPRCWTVMLLVLPAEKRNAILLSPWVG